MNLQHHAPFPAAFLNAMLSLVFASVIPPARGDTNGELRDLVRKMDRVRIPAQSFTGRLEVKRTLAGGQTPEPGRFGLFTRRREQAGRVLFDTLLSCNEPPRDAGKLVLFTDARCWLYDPRATHPTSIPMQQMGAQASFSESLNWSFAEDCDARLLREEPLPSPDAKTMHRCSVIEFTAKPEHRLLPPRMVYWVDAGGLSWKATHHTSGGKVLRTIEFTRYAPVLGAVHVVAMRLTSRGETHDLEITGLRAQESPAEYFEVRHLAKLKP